MYRRSITFLTFALLAVISIVPVHAAFSTQTTPPSQVTVQVARANLRGGPGTNYAVVGSANKGQALRLVSRNSAGTWYKLNSGAWIASFLVDGAPGNLPIVDEDPPPPPTPTLALLPASPAVDHGLCLDWAGNPVTYDQRGVARPQGAACDIGAVESPHTATFVLRTLAVPWIAGATPFTPTVPAHTPNLSVQP